MSADLKAHSIEELKIPKCMSDLKDKKANKGAKTIFTIKIHGDPLTDVKWFLNNIEMVDSENMKITKMEEHVHRLDVLDFQSNTAGEI